MTTNNRSITVSTVVRNIEARLVQEKDIVLMHTLTGPVGTVDSFVCGDAQLVGDDVVIFNEFGNEVLTTSRRNKISVVRSRVIA